MEKPRGKYQNMEKPRGKYQNMEKPLKHQRRLGLVWVYTCQNATWLEITCRGSFYNFSDMAADEECCEELDLPAGVMGWPP